MKRLFPKRWKTTYKFAFIYMSNFSFSYLVQSASKRYPYKNMFDFTTAGVWDFVAAVERLPALHYSVDLILLSFGIMGFIVELWNYKRITDEA